MTKRIFHFGPCIPLTLVGVILGVVLLGIGKNLVLLPFFAVIGFAVGAKLERMNWAAGASTPVAAPERQKSNPPEVP